MAHECHGRQSSCHDKRDTPQTLIRSPSIATAKTEVRVGLTVLADPPIDSAKRSARSGEALRSLPSACKPAQDDASHRNEKLPAPIALMAATRNDNGPWVGSPVIVADVRGVAL